jgi:hypothetical protein
MSDLPPCICGYASYHHRDCPWLRAALGNAIYHEQAPPDDEYDFVCSCGMRCDDEADMEYHLS